MTRSILTLAALLYVTPAFGQLGSTPVGEPPGPGFTWRALPGIGYGWVQDGITSAPNPAIGTAFTATRSEADALDAVNAKRAARGLRPYIRDDALTLGAQRCAEFRASRLMFGHTANDFQFLPSGASCSATGCAAYPASYGFLACAVYDGYTFAGAASAVGSDGRVYHSLFVR